MGARIVTIHNNPENLQPPARFKHLRFTLADVDTADVSQFFNASYEFIEEARVRNEGRSSYLWSTLILNIVAMYFIRFSQITAEHSYSSSLHPYTSKLLNIEFISLQHMILLW